MHSEYIDENMPSVISNEYDYSNIVPQVEYITYLVKYCDNTYKQFMNLIQEDEKKNEQFKTEYRSYNFKKSYGERFEIYIREKSYDNIICKDYTSFQSAINDGNLKNIISLKIKLELDYKRGKGENLIEHENTFTIIFKPYEIKFIRSSSHNEANMNLIENTIKDILNKFPIVNSIFCTK